MPLGGTLCKLFFRTTTSQPAGGSLVITVRVNTVDTLLKITIPPNGIAKTYSNVVNRIPVSAGDIISMSLMNNDPTLISAIIGQWAIVLEG